MALAPPMERGRRRPGRSGSFADLTLSAKYPVHGEHQTRVRQRDDCEDDTHRAGITELPLSERGSEKLLRHYQGGVVRAATRFQSGHVHECIKREDPDVDEGSLHVLAN